MKKKEPKKKTNSTREVDVKTLKDFQKERLSRSLEIRAEDIDDEKRTVALSFSSEEPVERWFGNEILSHEKKSVRLKRLKGGGAFLVNHDSRDQVGVVEKVHIDDDRKGRALIRFGKSLRAEEIFQDIKDGIRKNVSVGYEIHKLVLTEDSDDSRTYMATDWEPLEISTVSVPADINVGIGRNKQEPVIEPEPIIETKKEIKMTPEEIKAMRDKIEKEEREKAAKAIKLEQTRLKEITAIGRKHEMVEDAAKAIEDGTTLEDFRILTLEKVAERGTKAINTTKEPLTEPAEARGKFKTIGENLQAICRHKMGKGYDKRLDGVRAVQGLNEGVGSEGGFAVQTDLTGGIMQEAFEAGMLAKLCKPLTISNPSNSIEFLVMDSASRTTGSRYGGVRVYRVAEAETLTASELKLKRIKMELDKMAGVSYLTNEIIEDASALESITKAAFVEEFAYVTDEEIFRGTGGAQMLGLLNSDALVTVDAEAGQAAGTIVYENIVKMWARMFSRSKVNGVFLINQDITPQLHTMNLAVGTGGAPVYLPSTGAAGAPFGTLYGRPLLEIEQASTVGTVGDIVFADLSRYWLASKGGMREDTSIHVEFLTDQKVLRLIIRNTGRPQWDSALTPANGSNTTSPFVALATRS